uniref:PEP5/VPS11 N-terminal domain-containing protein n=1 Tax=Ditylenchus dipsaci TaxID=166011 RepID=A0A915DXH5_9BILA
MTYAGESEWPKFYFFDKISIPDPHEPAKKFSLKGLNVSFWANGQGFVLFGEPGGTIFRLSSDLEIQFWEAHQQKLFSFSLTANLVTSIGYDEPDVPVLKIWDLSQWERSFPLCKVNSRINLFNNFIAVGFSDSSVFYFYGDAQREKSMKYKSLREGANALGDGQLTGLSVAASETKEKVIVFVITDNSLSYYVVENGTVVRKFLDDAKGCDRNCWYFNISKNQLVVGGRENVHFYDVEACLNIEKEHETCFFLDGARIVQLCSYLELIHQKNMAAPPHTALLLGVYIKMNATDKLNTFLEQSAKLKGFDVEGAIQICLYLDQYGHVLMEHPDIENELLELIKKAVVSENANVKQLVNVLINSNKADKLEEVFDQMSSVKPVEDVFMRNAVLEQRLKTFAKKGSISPQKSRNIIELVNTDNFEQALHLGQIYKFAPLVIHILSQQNRLEDMLRRSFEEHPKSLVALLEKVSESKSNFVHPLVVLEILSRNNVLQVADVKDYIVKWLENQNNLIKDNQAGIQLNEKKIDEMDKAIEDLENKSV